MLPGVMPVVGRTDKEAFEKLNVLQSFVSGSNALAILSDRFGQDMSAYDLDGPVPDLEPSDSYHSFASVMLAKARREKMTLRDVYNLTAAARGHWVLCGSAERIADTLQQWFEEHAADGFNVMPPYFHEGFEDFVQLVVPILQERGLFRADYVTRLRQGQGEPGETRRRRIGERLWTLAMLEAWLRVFVDERGRRPEGASR